jgi:hypothetical protein
VLGILVALILPMPRLLLDLLAVSTPICRRV